MRESIFSVEAIKRQQEQANIQKKVGLNTGFNTEEKITSTRKVPMNITLPLEYKYKLQEYAKKKHLSASILIQMWIDEFCV